MSVYIAINYLDGEVIDTISRWHLAEELEKQFPVGEVYRYAEEKQGMQWRVLVRGYQVSDTMSYFPTLTPVKSEDVPEMVRMTALMAT